jgi:uncharacterized membrane protein YfcA
VLRRMIGALMLVMLVIVLAKPRRFLEAHRREREAPVWLEIAIFFLIGVYGGFIQAGVGILLLAGLVLGSGYDLVGANAIKNLIVFVLTAVALAVFVANHEVRWLVGALLAIGSAAGGWAGAHLTIEKGVRFVRWALVTILALSSAALIGDIGLTH